MRRLVIVESPTKARKIAGYLGDGYVVESSRGHIRDLPRAAADVPAKYKSEPWARLGVNVDADFEPLYIVSPDKKGTVTELKGLLKDVDELYLATDGDREGEAIAWHLLETLKPKVPVRRMVFHEITEQAILAAAQDPRDLDNNLVDAQETRRILDRLYGYEVSPCCGRRLDATCPPDVCSRWPPGSSCSANVTAWRSVALVIGIWVPSWMPARTTRRQNPTFSCPAGQRGRPAGGLGPRLRLAGPGQGDQ